MEGDEEQKYYYNPYSGSTMNISEAVGKARKEIGNANKEGRGADPELLINVGLILLLQFLLLKFLAG